MHPIVRLALVMTLTWVLLSGHFDPLLLTLGAASIALTVWLSTRLRTHVHRGQPLFFRPFGLLRYWLWLFVQIFVSNLDVARRVLSPSMPIRPALRKVAAVPDTEIGAAIYANSITLTPGTTAIGFTPEGEVLVHALHEESFEDLDAGEMATRVRAVEPDISLTRRRPGRPSARPGRPPGPPPEPPPEPPPDRAGAAR